MNLCPKADGTEDSVVWWFSVKILTTQLARGGAEIHPSLLRKYLFFQVSVIFGDSDLIF